MGIIRDSFVVFKNWYEAIEALPQEFQLETYKALSRYGLSGEIPEDISPIARAMLVSFSKGMEDNIIRYRNSVENGKKGGRPKKSVDENENLEKPTETQKNPEEPNQNLNVNVNDNDNVIVNDNEIENSLTREKESDGSLSTHTPKHKFGTYKNVLLTQEEYDRLISEPDGIEAIEYFSEYREMKGYKCKNDNLAIRKWAFAAVKEQKQKNNKHDDKSMWEKLGEVFNE